MKQLINICTVFCRLKKNAQVCIYSLADLNLDYCVEFTFLEGKLGRFLPDLHRFWCNGPHYEGSLFIKLKTRIYYLISGYKDLLIS